MRINAFVARSSGLSRRAVDRAIVERRVRVNGQLADIGQEVCSSDAVTLDNRAIIPVKKATVVMLNKPTGYVCSRRRQGNPTIYDLLPARFHKLKPVGRLDKDSSGLLLLTDDGGLANRLTHPSYGKLKVYTVILNEPITAADRKKVESGVQLIDGISQIKVGKVAGQRLAATIAEGRNRQVRRTFAALDYNVIELHRHRFGEYELPDSLNTGQYKIISEPADEPEH